VLCDWREVKLGCEGVEMRMGRCLCYLGLLHLHLCVCNERERKDSGVVVTASGVTVALVELSAFSILSRIRERRSYARVPCGIAASTTLASRLHTGDG
jgi:hypothetical protein